MGDIILREIKKIAVLDKNGNKISIININNATINKLMTFEDDVLVMINNSNTRKFSINYIDKINNKLGDGFDFHIKNWIKSDILGSNIPTLKILSPSEFLYISNEFIDNGFE